MLQLVLQVYMPTALSKYVQVSKKVHNCTHFFQVQSFCFKDWPTEITNADSGADT